MTGNNRLGPTQQRILDVLATKAPLTVAELSDLVNAHAHHLGETMRRLELKGFVARAGNRGRSTLWILGRKMGGSRGAPETTKGEEVGKNRHQHR
jgi:predicted ArsR family transcriptional regulator